MRRERGFQAFLQSLMADQHTFSAEVILLSKAVSSPSVPENGNACFTLVLPRQGNHDIA